MYFSLVCVEFGLVPVGLGFLFCLLLTASVTLVLQCPDTVDFSDPLSASYQLPQLLF